MAASRSPCLFRWKPYSGRFWCDLFGLYSQSDLGGPAGSVLMPSQVVEALRSVSKEADEALGSMGPVVRADVGLPGDRVGMSFNFSVERTHRLI